MSELAERVAARLADGEWFLGHDEVRGLVAEIGELRGRVDDLTGQVAGKDATIQRVRDYANYLIKSGVIRYEAFGRAVLVRIDGDPADDGSQK